MAMTLCIAAVAQYHGENVAILCSDAKVDEEAWGASRTAIKVHGVGHNMFAMIAGGWIIGNECAKYVATNHTKQGPPNDRSDALARIRRLCEDFLTVYSGAKNDFSLLISGFVGRDHLMIRADIVFNENGMSGLELESTPDVGAIGIGEGRFAASLLLKHRRYDPHNMELDRACYLVYEAKKFAETVGSVGEETRMAIHSAVTFPPNFVKLPDGATMGSVYSILDISIEGMAQLEKARKRFFLRSEEKFKFKPPFVATGG
jgi:hypothetical protein